MTIDRVKKTRGRPTVDSEAVNVRLPAQILRGIEAYAEKTGEQIGRPEAIRRILAEFLKRRGLMG